MNPSASATVPPATSSPPPGRRSFLAALGGLVLAGLALAVPAAAAVAAFLNPLRQKSSSGEPLRLATLDTLPADGTPQKVTVVAQAVNAWTQSRQPVGAIYLRRVGPQEVVALQAVCPHAGCIVEYRTLPEEAAAQPVAGFVCPCHKGQFALSGERVGANSPSPRDMDRLAVEIRNGNEVWVQFQSFQTGIPAQVPVT